MTQTTVAQVVLLSQQLTRRFKKMNDLMNEACLEHELAGETFRQLLIFHYKFLGGRGRRSRVLDSKDFKVCPREGGELLDARAVSLMSVV